MKPPEHRKSVTHPGRGAGDMRIPASLPGRVRFLFGSPVVSPPANGRGASGTDGFHLVCRLSHRLLIPIPHCEWITGGGASQSSLDFSPNSRRLWAKAQATLRSLRFARRTLGENACCTILKGDLVYCRASRLRKIAAQILRLVASGAVPPSSRRLESH